MPEPVPVAASDLAAAAGATPLVPAGTVPLDPAPPACGPTPFAPTSRRTIFRNFAGVAGIGLLSRGVGIVLDVYCRRTLGPGVIGMIDWNSSVLAYSSIAANPGLQTVARREAAKNPARMAEILLSTAVLQAGPLLLVVLTCLLCKATGVRSGVAGSLLVLQSMNVLVATFQLRWAFEAVDRYIVVNLLGLCALLLTAAATVAFVRAPENALRLVVVQLTVNGVLLTGAMVALAFRYGLVTVPAFRTAIRSSFRGLWKQYREALPLTLAGLSITLYVNSAALVLGPTHGDRAVGLFTTAYGLMTLGVVAASTLTSVYFPSLARSWQADDGLASARAASFDYFRAVLLTTAPIGLLGWALGGHVITLVYGSAYAAIGGYFEWLCLYLVFVSINMGLCGPLVSWGQNRKYLRVTMLGAAVNVGLNLALVPRFGVAGAVATAVATEAAVSVAAIAVRRRLVPIPYGRTFFSLLPIAVIAFAARAAAGRWPAAWPAVLLFAVLGTAATVAIFNRAVLARLSRRPRPA